jgi:hypothetical protein
VTPVNVETSTLTLRHDPTPEDGPNMPRLDELVASGRIHLEMMDDDWLWGRVETVDGRTVELSISVQNGRLVFRGEDTT